MCGSPTCRTRGKGLRESKVGHIKNKENLYLEIFETNLILSLWKSGNPDMMPAYFIILQSGVLFNLAVCFLEATLNSWGKRTFIVITIMN